MSETTDDLASELIASGFTKDEQKRGLIRWVLGFSMALNVFLIYSFIGERDKERKTDETHEEVLHEIIKMQSRTEQKVDTVLNKIP